MSVRIPAPVNLLLDWSSRNRLHITGAVVGVVWAAAVASQSLTVGAAATVFTVGISLIAVHTIRTRRLRESLAQARYDNAALEAQLADCRTGDPTDPTVQLRTIGETGERT
jgi:hypothetical protein